MKKIILGFSLVLAFASCKVPTYTIGSSESEFKSKNKYTLDIVEQTGNHSIYKIPYYANGNKTGYKFYYFQRGKLVRIDEGQATFGM